MRDAEFVIKKLTKFIYIQPEVSVSIEKILKKFNWLTRDDLLSILQIMENDNYIEMLPKNTFGFSTVGTVDDDNTFVEVMDKKTTPIVTPTHVLLTLKGKNNAEEQRALLIKARKELIAQPIVNSIISGIVGFILGYLFHSM